MDKLILDNVNYFNKNALTDEQTGCSVKINNGYPAMHPVLLYILGWLGGAVIGVLSAGIVFGLWWLLRRRFQVGPEMVFAVCGLVGFATMFVGKLIDSRALSAASVALWGWVIVPIIVIPVLLLWRLFAWCRHRIAG